MREKGRKREEEEEEEEVHAESLKQTNKKKTMKCIPFSVIFTKHKAKQQGLAPGRQLYSAHVAASSSPSSSQYI